MLHSIPTEKFGPLGRPMTHAVESCVHCGFCLAACPTYRELGQEMDTPRGRIVLMKEVLEGKMPLESAMPHVDRCLGCLACEPACPSGVPYRDLISPFRAIAQNSVSRPWTERLRRFVSGATVPYAERFRIAATLGSYAKKLLPRIPGFLRPMLDLLPDQIPDEVHLPKFSPACGRTRARVALLAGCAQQVLDPDINLATIEVLTRNGVEVLVPGEQGCCGGLAWHTGDLESARAFARRNLRAFPSDIDAIVSNAAGCGSAMHEYPLILAGTTDEAGAEAFRDRIIDVSAFLARLGCTESFPMLSPVPRRVTYQDACHLSNAQNIRLEPRALLQSIPGVELVEIADAHLCCGSAGSYNLDQPEIAASLGAAKVKSILDTRPDIIASGNIGCLTQLQHHLRLAGSRVPIRHTMQILRDAYREGTR